MRTLVLLSAVAVCASAQQGQKATSPAPTQQQTAVNPRKAQLKADSDALAKAATELKELLDKTKADEMSLPVIKKAEEVQRLAKQVQKDLKQK